MSKNETKNQVQVDETIETTTVENQGEQATTEDEPKKESLVQKAKNKASGFMNKQISFTPKNVLLGIGKGVLAIGAVAGAFALGKKVQEQTDSAFLETDFVEGEEPVEALPDDVVEEVEEPVYEEVAEEYVEE